MLNALLPDRATLSTSSSKLEQRHMRAAKARIKAMMLIMGAETEGDQVDPDLVGAGSLSEEEEEIIEADKRSARRSSKKDGRNRVGAGRRGRRNSLWSQIGIEEETEEESSEGEKEEEKKLEKNDEAVQQGSSAEAGEVVKGDGAQRDERKEGEKEVVSSLRADDGQPNDTEKEKEGEEGEQSRDQTEGRARQDVADAEVKDEKTPVSEGEQRSKKKEEEGVDKKETGDVKDNKEDQKSKEERRRARRRRRKKKAKITEEELAARRVKRAVQKKRQDLDQFLLDIRKKQRRWCTKLKLCSQCGFQAASTSCLDCRDDFCDSCFSVVHQRGGLALHTTQPTLCLCPACSFAARGFCPACVDPHYVGERAALPAAEDVALDALEADEHELQSKEKKCERKEEKAKGFYCGEECWAGSHWAKAEEAGEAAAAEVYERGGEEEEAAAASAAATQEFWQAHYFQPRSVQGLEMFYFKVTTKYSEEVIGRRKRWTEEV